MSEFKRYRKVQTQLMRPYVPGEDLSGISVSERDTPAKGGMIAIAADDPSDMWYINEEFFSCNYEEVEE